MKGNSEKATLPSGWIWTILDHACTLITDGTHHSPKVQYDAPAEGRYRYITSKNVRHQGVTLDNVTYVDGDIHHEIYGRCPVEKGDVLLIKDGVNTGIAAVNQLEEPFSLLSSVALLKPSGGVNARYVKHFLNSPVGFQHVTGEMSGSAIKRIILRRLKVTPISLPPSAEQQRIVDKIDELLSDLDAAVAALQAAQRQLQRYRQSVLKAAVEGKLTEAWRRQRGHEVEPTNLPSGWTLRAMGDLLSDIEAGRSFKCEERPPENGETGIVKVSAVTWGVFQEDESKTVTTPTHVNSDYFIGSGDFLFSRANTIELVGACIIVGEITRKLMLSDKILRFHFSNVQEHYILYYLRSPQGRKQIEDLASGNQHSMRNISQRNIKRIVVPLPPAAEQEQIVEEVERLLSVADEVAQTIEHELKRAERLRQGILKRAFSGKLVPQDPNDEPAEALLARIQAAKRTPGKNTVRRGNGRQLTMEW